MNNMLRAAALCLGLVSLPALAASKDGISRGGFGLLFPDHQSLQNLGQTARTRGFGFEGSWGKFTGTHEQTLMASAAYASGSFALSAYGNRYGMDVFDSNQSEEILGVGIGFAPGDLAFGVSYEKEHDVYRTIARLPTAYAVKGALTYASKGPFVAGVAVKSTIDRSASQVQTLEVALGLKGDRAAVEAVQTVSSISGDWSSGLLGKWQGQSLYIAGGGVYLGSLEAVQVLARLGLVWGPLDFSALVTQIIKDNQNPFHSFLLRFTF